MRLYIKDHKESDIKSLYKCINDFFVESTPKTKGLLIDLIEDSIFQLGNPHIEIDPPETSA